MNTNTQKKLIAGLAGLTLVLAGALAGVLIAGATSLSMETGSGNGAAGTVQNVNYAQNAALPAQASAVLNAYQEAFRALSKDVMPSVVMVQTARPASKAQANSPFRFFFDGREFNQTEPESTDPDETVPSGSGSGVLVARKGSTVFVMTNNHVVEGATAYTVRTWNHQEYKAELVGADKNRDIAVLKISTEDSLSLAKLGDSTKTQVGDIVFAIGAPYGIQNTITQGIVSAVGRNAKDFSTSGGPGNNFTDYIQTDAAINQGNSGGALVNIAGEVIGINTWIATQTGGNVGLGFSVPANNAWKVASDIIEKGRVEYGFLGVSGMELPEVDKRALGLSGKDGAFVASVFWDSPAAKAGIRPGDLILSFDTDNLASSNDLVRSVSSRDPAKTYVVKYLRDGKTQEVKVTLGIRDETLLAKGTWPGFAVTSVTEAMQKRMKGTVGIGSVVITDLAEGSAAADVGIGAGDVVTAINGTAVKNLADYYRALAAAKSPAVELTLINRSGREVTVKFQP